MRVATWNLNHRVGKTTFRPEAADAAVTLGAEVIVFNEYFPKDRHTAFSAALSASGWGHQEISVDTGAAANRIFIASTQRLDRIDVALPDFDRHFPANLLCVAIPAFGICMLGVRIPWYERDELPLVASSWNWLESFANDRRRKPTLILGDLNVSLRSRAGRGGDHFRRILNSGWHRAQPLGDVSFYGGGAQKSEIDHILGTSLCRFSNARYVAQSAGYQLAGRGQALSDHAALVAEVNLLGDSA